MLNKTERKLLHALNEVCGKRQTFLVSPIDLIKISSVKELNTEKLDRVLTELYMDGYFDLIVTDRHGEKVYCITLTEKAKGYERSVKVFKRNIIFRVCLTTALAVFSFLIGVILKRIF